MIKMIVCTMVILLAACAPAPAARMSAAAPVASVAHSEPAATPTSAPIATTNFDPGAVSRACKVDADCEVKNVGNCCGAHRTCVNKDAATNPGAVRAQCQKEHRMSVCSMEAVGGCSCVKGECRDINSAQMPGAN